MRETIGAPPTSRCFIDWNIASAILGMPAKVKTFSIWKPGATETGLSTRMPPCGHARHAPPRRREQRRVAVVRGHARDRLGMLGDADAEGLGDAVGGDVVMGRTDAAGGEDVVELPAHLVDRGDDGRLDVGDDAASMSRTPSSFSSAARYWMLASWVRPLRISLPMTSMQAVTVFGSSDMRRSFFRLISAD